MEHWSSKLIEAATDFETAWSAQWVQMNVFGEEIQAESKFWRKFMGDLDVALAPINAKMELLSRGIADKPRRIEEGLHIPQSEQ